MMEACSAEKSSDAYFEVYSLIFMSFFFFHACEMFQVHDNRLVSLPNALGDLENLQKLDIRYSFHCVYSSASFFFFFFVNSCICPRL